jgi:aspartate aminotransferase-like enzyme
MPQVRLPLVPGPVSVPAAVLAARERDYPSAGLEVACRRLIEEGLERAHRRHQDAAALCRERGRALGLELFPRDESASSPTVTAFKVPERIGWPELNRRFRQHGLAVGGNYDRLAGRNFRLGHMGTQADCQLVAAAMEVVGEALRAEPDPIRGSVGVFGNR